MSASKVGATNYNQEIAQTQRSLSEIREALLATVRAIGERNSVALHYLSIAGLELSQVQEAVRHLDEIGRFNKERRLQCKE